LTVCVGRRIAGRPNGWPVADRSVNGRRSKGVHCYRIICPPMGILAAVRPKDFGTSRSQLYPELTLSLHMLRRGAVPDLPRNLSFGFGQMEWSDFRRSCCTA
jgi:hypothetical protein